MEARTLNMLISTHFKEPRDKRGEVLFLQTWNEVLMPMIYFLFLPDAWEAFPYVLKLVTNMGTEGGYQSIVANTYISLRMGLVEEINADPIVHSPEMTYWYRCYISYSYWMYEKHFRMYQYWSQIWELRVGIGVSMPTRASRWECAYLKK